MRAFGIGLPLAAEMRRGHWNHLAIAIDPSWDGRLIPIPIAIPIAIPKEYVELRNNDAYPAFSRGDHLEGRDSHLYHLSISSG